MERADGDLCCRKILIQHVVLTHNIKFMSNVSVLVLPQSNAMQAMDARSRVCGISPAAGPHVTVGETLFAILTVFEILMRPAVRQNSAVTEACILRSALNWSQMYGIHHHLHAIMGAPSHAS